MSPEVQERYDALFKIAPENEHSAIVALLDAGADEPAVKRYLESSRVGQLELITSLRSALLGDIHKREECLCRLDYLRYQIKEHTGD